MFTAEPDVIFEKHWKEQRVQIDDNKSAEKGVKSSGEQVAPLGPAVNLPIPNKEVKQQDQTVEPPKVVATVVLAYMKC